MQSGFSYENMELGEYFMPYSVVAVDHGTPVFSLRDINLYGQPHLFGVDEYLVLDDPTESCPFVLDYKEERARRGALRPIHRYSQDKRFELLLRKFLGGRCSEIKNEDLFLTVAMGCNWDKDHIWNSVRKILKENGWSRYYDNIPSILHKIGYEYKIISPNAAVVDEIMNDFKKISHGFGRKKIGTRKYMINFRFVALKLLERYGVVFEYHVPKLQTARKYEEFEKVWLELKTYLD